MKSTTPIDLSMQGYSPSVDPVQPAAAPVQAEPAPKRRDAARKRVTPDPSEPEKPRRRPAPERRPGVNPIIAFFRSARTRYVLGVFLTVLAVVALIVTFSYVKTGVADQSVVESMSIAAAADSGQPIENPGGAAGASLAHLLLVDTFGISSLVLVFYTGMLGLSLFGLVRVRFWSFTFKCLFTAISLSIILGMVTYSADSTIYWGGNHGHYVNLWLMHISDWVGMVAVSVILASLLVILYIAQIKTIIDQMSGRMAKARAAMAAAAAAGRKPSGELAEVPEAEAVADTPDTAQAPTISVQPLAVDDTPAPAVQEPSELPAAPGIVGFDIDDEPAGDTADDSAGDACDTPAESAPDTPAPLGPAGAPTVSIVAAEPKDEADGTEPGQEPVPTEPLNVRDELSHYRFPGLDLLTDRPVTAVVDEKEQQEKIDMIIAALQSFKVGVSHVSVTVGPTVTRFEIVPAEGVLIAKIRRLEDDIARSLEALGVRIVAPIPGKNTVGIEVPNRNPQTVSMRRVVASAKFRECRMALPLALGATIENEIFIADLAKMPHLLVAGATGMGKSVGLNCIIASLLYKKHPGELKFVLIDPKMVEFSLYSRIEHHYLAKLPGEEEPIVTEPSKALETLQSLCIEMDQRYELLKTASVRNVEEYNAKYCSRVLNPEKGHRYMPYIVVIVDEFADLIMTAGKDISSHITRIAQKARAVGMHLIIATQRPSTDVITGVIKANFPTRIAFTVATAVDSKTILDRTGANRLAGKGDMIFSQNNRIERVQCAFIDTPEVNGLCDFIDRQTGYETAYLLPEPEKEGGAIAPGAVDLSKRDSLFDDCARFIVQSPTASVSILQRRFGIGYNKAGKIMDQLEAAGIVGPADGQRPRQVLVDAIAVENLLQSL